MERGIVTGLDRTNGVVRARLDTGEDIEAPCLANAWPWPLATAWFEPAGAAFVCVGPIGDQRVVARDDFTSTVNATTLTADTMLSSVAWRVATTGTASIDTTNDVTDPTYGDTTAAGVRRLVAPTGSTAYIRALDQAITIPDQDQAVWMSFRANVSVSFALDSDSFAWVGLGNANVASGGGASATDSAAYVYLAADAVNFDAVRGTSYTEATGPALEYSTAWYWFDIVAVSEQFAAFWFDGSGPYVVDSNVPVLGDQGFEPFAYLSNTSGADVAVGLDLIDVRLVNPVAHASDYALETSVIGSDRSKP